MKTMKTVLCLMVTILMICSLCACGSSGGTTVMTQDQEIRSAVESRGMIEYMGSKIGGNDIKSSRATVTNVKKVSDYTYLVSGKMVMTDVYGTNWKNTFDCKVTQKSNGNWSAGSFEYTSKNWSKY